MARRASLISLALLAIPLWGWVVAPDIPDRGRIVVADAWLISNLVLLTGGCLLHTRWRTTQESAMAWLAAVFLVPSFVLVPVAMIHATDPAPRWTTTIATPLELVVGIPIVVFIVLVRRKTTFPPRLNPIGVAAVVAVPCMLAAVAVSSVVGTALSPPPAALVHAPTLVFIVVGAVMVGRLAWLRVSHRVSLTIAVAGLAGAHDFRNLVALYEDVQDADEFAAAGIAVVSSVVIVVLTLGLFRRALDQKARRLAAYQARAEVAEEWMRREEELMHEVRATIAGISHASYLLQGDLPMTASVSERDLRAMMGAEIGRVQRLLCAGATAQPVEIDLDELLSAQVTAQRALGHDIRWEPRGIVAFGRPDNVTEAVHVVLTNATRYAAGGPVHVLTCLWGDSAKITITDFGPGVPRDLQGVIFERGTQEAASPGLGVGLYLARAALLEDGGSISLRQSRPGCGATFVIALPTAIEASAIGAES